MKKYLTMFIALLMLNGCLEPKTIVGSEYKLAPKGLVDVVIGFNDDGTFYGNAANAINGTYTINGNKLAMNLSGKTNLSPRADIIVYEREFFGSLPKVVSYSLSGPNLTLTMYNNQKLIFERIGRAQVK